MKTKKSLFFLPLVVMLFSYTELKNSLPNIIQGTVISEKTGKPVSGAYVYVVNGEEEDITNNKGEFKIESWQKLPLTITVEEKSHEKTKVSVSNPSQKQLIRLKPKS